MEKNTSNGNKKYRHLNREEREEMAILLEIGLKQCEIAKKLQRDPGTISREKNRNKSYIRNGQYRTSVAQYKADKRKKLSHKRKRIPQKKLRSFIYNKIKEGYSPEIIAVKALEKNVRWKTNYESIYQWIYSERHELIPFLVRSHKKRRKRGSGKQKRCPKIPNRIMIDKRPEYINLRTGIGHWEIDTAISRKSKAAIMVLVERRSRYVIIKKLFAKTAYYMHKKNFLQKLHIICTKQQWKA